MQSYQQLGGPPPPQLKTIPATNSTHPQQPHTPATFAVVAVFVANASLLREHPLSLPQRHVLLKAVLMAVLSILKAFLCFLLSILKPIFVIKYVIFVFQKMTKSSSCVECVKQKR
jgi:hypothetical protein